MVLKSRKSLRLTTQKTLRPTDRNEELLNEDELLFLWKGLVENGQLSISKLQTFMREVAGVSMSIVQARDLLDYMDANGDGRVGMEDFKNFLSIGHLAETDAKSFMWEPKKKFQEENPLHKAMHDPPASGHHHLDHHHHGHHHDSHLHEHHSHGHHAADHHEHHEHHEHPVTVPSGHAAATALRRGSISQGDADQFTHTQSERRTIQRQSTREWAATTAVASHERRDSHDRQNDLHRTVTAPPGPQASAKRRPHHGGLHHEKNRSSLYSNGAEVLEEIGHHHPQPDSSASVVPKKPRPPPLTPETEKKIEQALLKYEALCWDKLQAEEKAFKRHLFEQFAGAGGEELEVTEYHKMLMKWIQHAEWCAPRGLRPADSLAALEYVLRRDLEERGGAPRTYSKDLKSNEGQQEGTGNPAPPRPGAAGAAPISPTFTSSAPSVKMTYSLWLDVLSGKHRPEEHLCDLRSAHHHGHPHPEVH